MLARFVSAAAAIGLAVLCSVALAQSPAPTPPNLATVHAQQSKLTCTACHGDAKSLAEKLAPKLVHKEINPHGSHLVEIDCVTCHRGHSAGEAYCQQCHAFDMTMPPKAKK